MNFMVSARVGPGPLAADAATGAAGTTAAGGCSADAAPPFAKIALSSASVAPACLSAASASAEVSNLPGVAEITCNINLSCTPFRSSFKTSALAGASLSGLGGGRTDCCAERVKANPQKRHAASKFFMFMILSSSYGNGGSRDCSLLPPCDLWIESIVSYPSRKNKDAARGGGPHSMCFLSLSP